ncbi:hypothetical protein BYT27DRAFT_6436043 [Phlegmacium glaucopus]|nr:hypothetical protein BYT27DRAFT_6436043 [Phlegmacium glaucopus]
MTYSDLPSSYELPSGMNPSPPPAAPSSSAYYEDLIKGSTAGQCIVAVFTFEHESIILLILLSVSSGLLLAAPHFLRVDHNLRVPSASTSRSPIQILPLLPLTIYRAHMMLNANLAIVTVDFPVFL